MGSPNCNCFHINSYSSSGTDVNLSQVSLHSRLTVLFSSCRHAFSRSPGKSSGGGLEVSLGFVLKQQRPGKCGNVRYAFDISVRIMAHKPSNPFCSALHHHPPRLHVWSGSTRTVLVWALASTGRETEGGGESQREASGRQEHGTTRANTAKKDEVLQRVREQPVMELQRIGERGCRGEQRNLKDL